VRSLPADRAQENARLRQALQTMQAENDDLAEEVAGARSTLRTVERKNQTLASELTKRNGTSADAEKITSILQVWVRVSGKNEKRTRIDLDSDRAKLVRKMSKTFQFDELMDAIKGAGLIPYMAFGERVPKSTREAKHAMELDQIIGKVKYVEQNRDNYRRAQNSSDTDRFWDAYEHRHAESLAYADAVLYALEKRDTPEISELLDEVESAESSLPANVVPLRPKAAA
jgi:hypothetical protein